MTRGPGLVALPTELEPLFDRDVERAVLGAILADCTGPTLETVRGLVAQSDFGVAAHGLVYGAMVSLLGEGQPCDHVTVASRLKARGELSTVGGPEYLMGCDQVPATAEHVRSYCLAIRDYATRRALVALARDMAAAARKTTVPVADTLALYPARLAQVASGRSRIVTLREAKELAAQEIDQRHNGGPEPAVATGFAELDRLTGGWPLNLAIVAMMPGVGKDALSIASALRIAQRGEQVGILSAEDPSVYAAYRALAAESGVSQFRLRYRQLLTDAATDEWAAVGDGFARMHAYDERVIFDDRQGLSASEAVQSVRELVVIRKCRAVFVNNLSSIHFEVPRGQTKTEAIGRFLLELRTIATTHKAAVVALMHIARRPGLTPKDMPTMSDVRESGAAEILSRLLVLGCREPGSSVLTLRIAKQNGGGAGDDLDLHFDKSAALAAERERELFEFGRASAPTFNVE